MQAGRLQWLQCACRAGALAQVPHLRFSRLGLERERADSPGLASGGPDCASEGTAAEVPEAFTVDDIFSAVFPE